MKLLLHRPVQVSLLVTSYAEVWIEILVCLNILERFLCHLLRGGVD